MPWLPLVLQLAPLVVQAIQEAPELIQAVQQVVKSIADLASEVQHVSPQTRQGLLTVAQSIIEPPTTGVA